MPNSDLLPSLLFKINENQIALEAAICLPSASRALGLVTEQTT